MRFIKTIIGVFLVINLFNSCAKMSTVNYLKKCNERIQTQQEDKYYLSTLAELKANLAGGTPLFYVGSNSRYDYFVFYYDKLTKLTVGFKVPKGQFKLENEVSFETTNYFLKKYPVYLKDF